MSEDFDIFKNLEDLRKTNYLDRVKNLEFADISDPNVSKDLENEDFDLDALLNDNIKKSPKKRQRKVEKLKTPEKKSKKNAKSRRISISTDGSISPTLPLIDNVSKKIDEMPISRRTRRSLDLSKITSKGVISEELEDSQSVEPSSSRAKGRLSGRGRGNGAGRARTRGRGRASSKTSPCTSRNLKDSCQSLSSSINLSEEDSNQHNTSLVIMEPVPQRSRRERRSHVMRARRQYVAEIAARSTQVDFIDLVSSPLPRVEGVIDLDSDLDQSIRITRSKTKSQEQFSFNKIKKRLSKNASFDISFDEDNPELNIKVNWKGKPESFHLRKYQKFSVIFQQLAEREKIDMDNIVFNLNDRIILPDDTPDSINYKIFQFINGRVLSNRFNLSEAATVAEKKRDINKITLKIQSDKWKHPLQIDMMKTDKFRILYIKCAEELKVGHDQLKLSFDGEFLELNDTPVDLELEGGEAIDLRMKN